MLLDIQNELLSPDVSVWFTPHPKTLRFPDYNEADKEQITKYTKAVEEAIWRKIFIPDLRTHKWESRVIEDWDLWTHIKVDSVITNSRNIALCLLTADCAPILIYDFENSVIAAVHWSKAAIENDVIETTLRKMQENFSTQAGKILIHVWPTICQSHYEITQGSAPWYSEGNIKAGNIWKSLLNLRWEILDRSTDLGVQRSNIDSPERCTYWSTDLFSFRRKTHELAAWKEPVHANNGALIWVK